MLQDAKDKGRGALKILREHYDRVMKFYKRLKCISVQIIFAMFSVVFGTLNPLVAFLCLFRLRVTNYLGSKFEPRGEKPRMLESGTESSPDVDYGTPFLTVFCFVVRRGVRDEFKIGFREFRVFIRRNF